VKKAINGCIKGRKKYLLTSFDITPTCHYYPQCPFKITWHSEVCPTEVDVTCKRNWQTKHKCDRRCYTQSSPFITTCNFSYAFCHNNSQTAQHIHNHEHWICTHDTTHHLLFFLSSNFL